MLISQTVWTFFSLYGDLLCQLLIWKKLSSHHYMCSFFMWVKFILYLLLLLWYHTFQAHRLYRYKLHLNGHFLNAVLFIPFFIMEIKCMLCLLLFPRLINQWCPDWWHGTNVHIGTFKIIPQYMKYYVSNKDVLIR